MLNPYEKIFYDETEETLEKKYQKRRQEAEQALVRYHSFLPLQIEHLLQPAALWRLNSEECQANELDPEHQEFSTLKQEGITRLNLRVGSLIVALMAGKRKYFGLHSIWCVTDTVYKCRSNQVNVYLTCSKAKRRREQERIRCKQLIRLTRPNLRIWKQYSLLKPLRHCQVPTRLKKDELYACLDLVKNDLYSE